MLHPRNFASKDPWATNTDNGPIMALPSCQFSIMSNQFRPHGSKKYAFLPCRLLEVQLSLHGIQKRQLWTLYQLGHLFHRSSKPRKDVELRICCRILGIDGDPQKCTILGVGFLRIFTPLLCVFMPLSWIPATVYDFHVFFQNRNGEIREFLKPTTRRGIPRSLPIYWQTRAPFFRQRHRKTACQIFDNFIHLGICPHVIQTLNWGHVHAKDVLWIRRLRTGNHLIDF